MKTLRIFLALAISIFAFSYQVFSQTYLLNSNQAIETCSGTIYDSGGSGGQYSNNENYTVILCSDNGSVIQLQFTAFNLATGDMLTIYNGAGTTGNILATGTGTSLNGQTIVADVNCVALVWTTNASGTATGFAANIICSTLCQGYTSDIVANPSITDPVEMYLDICPGQVVNFSAASNFFNNGSEGYTQTTANTTYHWEMINEFNQLVIDQSGLGLTNISYTFNASAGYSLSLRSEDVQGCWNMGDATLRIRVSVPPTFTGTTLAPTPICPGETVTFTGHVQTYPWQMSVVDTQIVGQCVEDHYVGLICFDVNTFAPGQTINSANDLASVCINMEHSYIGDFYMYIRCPNGQEAMLHEYYNCNNAYFGLPNHSDNCVPGTGWDYCWSMSASQAVTAVCSSGQSVPAGTYLPLGNFNTLIGCPINGEWCIRFYDNWGADDGYIWTADLNFSPAIMPQDTWGYENAYDQGTNSPDGAWSGPNMVDATGFIGTAAPTVSGNINYTFTATDDFGCSYDTTIMVVVKPITDPSCCIMPDVNAGPDEAVCSNSYHFNATDLTPGNSGVWVVTSGPPGAAFDDAGDPNTTVTVSIYGTYTFTWTEYYLGNTNNLACSDNDAVTITFNETFDPTITAINDMCVSVAPFQIYVADFGTLTCSPSTPALNATTGVFNPEQAGPGVYTITNTITGPCVGAGFDNETFEIFDEIEVVNFSEVCGPTGSPTLFTVSWDVQGSAGSPYTGYLVNGVSQGNAHYTTDIVSPGSYNYTITDPNGCSNTTISGFRDCGCPLYAGTMGSLQTVILCQDECTVPDVTHNGDQETDGGAGVFEFMIHTGNNIPLAYSSTPNFCFNNVPGATYNTIYYVSAICGLPSGGHATLSGCFSIAAGTPVMWQQNPISSAGANRDTCGLVIQLNGNTPTSGMYGYWSSDCEFFAVGGTSHTQPNAIVMSTQFNTCTFTWNVVNGQCVASDDVVIGFLDTPNPYAGDDMTVCGNTTTMNGVPSLTGTDLIWTGNGTSFNPQSSANAQALVSIYGTYQYTLTESNSACEGSDQVLITYVQPPSPLVLNNSDTVCGTQYNLHVITTANADGHWAAYNSSMVLLSPQPIFVPSIYEDTVLVTIGNYPGYYQTVIFEWVEKNQVNGIECFSSVTQEVVFAREPVASVGASDEAEICGSCITFAADTTGSGWAEGYWIPRGLIGEFADNNPNKPDATFCISEVGNFGDTAHVRAPMLWAMRNYGCISMDTMWVTFYQRPVANAGLDDAVCGNNYQLEAFFDITENAGYVPTGQWFTYNPPVGQTANITPLYNDTAQVTVSQVGIWNFIFRENNSFLTSCYSTDTVRIEFVENPVIFAGEDKDVCGQQTQMEGVSGGNNGSWLPTPGATFVDYTDPTTSVTASYGERVFYWLESNQATTSTLSCTSKDSVIITFWRRPTANILTDEADSTVCGLTFEHLRAENPGSEIEGYWYNINPATVYGDAFSWNTWATVPNYGYHDFYWIEETGPGLTPGFCNDTAGPLTIRFIQIPNANAGGDTLFCGYCGYLRAIPSIGQGVWSTPSGLNITYADETLYNTQVCSNVINTGNPTYPDFTLIWTEDNSNGCTDSDTMKVIFARVPSSNMQIIAPKCFGEPATIKAAEDSLQQYTWNFYGGIIDSVAPNNPMGGTYENFVYWTDEEESHIVSLIATNFWECQSPINMDTIVEPAIPDFGVRIISDTCALGKGGIIFEDTVLSNAFFWLHPEYGPPVGTAVTTVYNLPAGDYDIRVSYLTPNITNYAYYIQTFGTANCIDTVQYEIETIGMIEAEISISADIILEDLVAPEANVIFINSSFYDNVGKRCEWHFGDGTIQKTCDELVEHVYTKAGCYDPFLIVMNRDLLECRDTAYLETCVFVDDMSKLEIPNIFSPNADGVNDFFQVKAQTLRTFSGVIMNRWGRTIYEWDNWRDYEAGWDGNLSGGTKASPGVYYYIIKAEGIDGTPYDFQGVLHLMRE